MAVAAVVIPSAIAYPAIAGLPAEAGFYASILSILGYALFGPSRKLIVGPDAATMTVLAATLASLPLADLADRASVAAALALMVGVLCILARKLNLGVLASFLSRPTRISFISGISISIYIRSRLESVAKAAPPGTSWFVLDASAVAQVEMTAAAMLLRWRAELAAMGLSFAIAELHRRPWDILERAGLFDGPNAIMAFDDLEDAVRRLGKEDG